MRFLAWALLCFCATVSAQTNPDVLFADGVENCSTYLDGDEDRLVDCQETLGNVSDPANPDTDGDGYNDGDEVLGTPGGLNLAAFGLRPKKRDILVESDWVIDSLECGAHNHRAPDSAITGARAIFANAPVANPDGSTGINLIVDYGQGGVFTGGNGLTIPANATHPEGILDRLGPKYQAARDANFAPNRVGYFHYQLQGHRYDDATTDSSGWAEVGGDDGFVTLNCLFNPDWIRNTIVHELGHNLGLWHGGSDNCNRKPNYNSLMNYTHQFHGVDTDCDRFPNGAADLSKGTNVPLDENALNENDGVCGAGNPLKKAIDWNTNGKYEPNISHELVCFGLSVLTDYDDWGNLDYATFPPPNDSGGAQPPVTIGCDGPPES